MKTWVCTVCGWVYDEAAGDADYDGGGDQYAEHHQHGDGVESDEHRVAKAEPRAGAGVVGGDAG